MVHIQVIHRPNLNLLGQRERHVYRRLTLANLDGRLRSYAANQDFTLRTFRWNRERAIIFGWYSCHLELSALLNHLAGRAGQEPT